MKDAMKISIVTVVFNAVNTIEQTIQSVIKQDYKELEYIVIDGGSTDGTLEIIQKYQNEIAYWISEPDSGIYNAMNKGIEIAKGEIIAFLNSGDWYEQDTLIYVAEKFKSDVDILVGRVISYGDDVQRMPKKVVNQEELKIRMIYCHQGIFARKKLFERYSKFDERYKVAADYDWLLRMYYRGVSIKCTNRIFAYYRIGGVSSGNNFLANQEPKEIAMRVLRELKEQHKVDDVEYEKIKCMIVRNHQNNMHTFYAKQAIKRKLLKRNDIRSEVKNIFHFNYSIFGCGEVGKECLSLLQAIDIFPKCFWDNDRKKWGTYFEGIVTKCPKGINECDSIVIIASTYYEEEIKKQLERMGLEEDINFICYTHIRDEVGNIVQRFVSVNELIF